MKRILPRDLKTLLDAGTDLLLLDVREAEEAAVATLGGTLIPLHELPSRVDEIPRDRDIVVLCHHGIRSAHAVAFLESAGITRASNLTGGIDRWSLEVDPKVPRY